MTTPNRKSRSGFTLVEVMIAATISLVLVGLVVQIFATVGTTASETRAVVQMTDRLRSARIVMQQDLSNVTAEMLPPLKTDRAAGYFEYVEGPDGPIFPGLGASPVAVAYDVNQVGAGGLPPLDSTVGDPDDVLMFTAQATTGTYFYGRTRTTAPVVDAKTGWVWPSPVDAMTQSSQAEICYFMRGDTLYRRVLLVSPTTGVNGKIDPTIFLWSQYPQNIAQGQSSIPQPTWDIAFYDKFDVSVRQVGGMFDLLSGNGGTLPPALVPNSLSDLTQRQNRYGHQPWVYPYDIRFWDARFWTNPATNVAGGFLGLPTFRECSCYLGSVGAGNGTAVWPFPLYENPNNPNPIALSPVPVLGAPGGLIPVTGNASIASQNLWGSPQASGSVLWPYSNVAMIYPYPTAAYAATYQPNTLIPAAATGRLLLTSNKGGLFDLWSNPYPLDQQDPVTGAIYAFSSAYQPPSWVNVNVSTRYADDVLLTHVLSFDVKAWDPTAPTIQLTSAVGNIPAGTYMPGDPGYVQIINTWANGANALTTLQQNLQPVTSGGLVVAQGAYVDLNYLGPVISQFIGPPVTTMAQALSQVSVFSGPGIAQFGSSFSTGSGLGMLYDTGCFDYENDGIDQNLNGIIDEFTNGLDDNGIGGVDDLTEVEGPVPYPVPLKGIQIKIRVYDPDSRQIREVTLTQDFLWE